jgi:hypothetical protein
MQLLLHLYQHQIQVHSQVILAYVCEVTLAVGTQPDKTNPLFFLMEQVH